MKIKEEDPESFQSPEYREEKLVSEQSKNFESQIEKCKIVIPTNRLTPPNEPALVTPQPVPDQKKSGYSEYEIHEPSNTEYVVHNPSLENKENAPEDPIAKEEVPSPAAKLEESPEVNLSQVSLCSGDVLSSIEINHYNNLKNQG